MLLWLLAVVFIEAVAVVRKTFIPYPILNLLSLTPSFLTTYKSSIVISVHYIYIDVQYVSAISRFINVR
jgi:hypothetical protein